MRPKNPKFVDCGPTYRLKKGLHLAKKSIFDGFWPITQPKMYLETQKFQNLKKYSIWDPMTPKKVIFINRGRIYGLKQGLKIAKNIGFFAIYYSISRQNCPGDLKISGH